MTRPTIGIAGYKVEIAMEIHLGGSEEEGGEHYECVRAALADYEDALAPPLWVTITRRAPLRLSNDELKGVLSICREAMVDVLGVASDHPEVGWSYRQSEGSYAVIVEVRPEPRP